MLGQVADFAGLVPLTRTIHTWGLAGLASCLAENLPLAQNLVFHLFLKETFLGCVDQLLSLFDVFVGVKFGAGAAYLDEVSAASWWVRLFTA